MPRFQDLIGQTAACEKAADWLASKRGQALLIYGLAGSGKKTLGRALAQALLCVRPDRGGACLECASCRCFTAETHPDYREIVAGEDEKGLKVATIRERVLADAQMRPQLGQARAYLISGDDLNEQGQNALLKTLEEAPEGSYFILTAARPEKLLSTVRSRLVPLHLPPLSVEDMGLALERHGLDASAAAGVTASANGSPGQAMELLNSVWFPALRRELVQMLMRLPKRAKHLLLTEDYQFIDAEKEHFPAFLDLLLSDLRDLYALASGVAPAQLLNGDLYQEWQQLLRRAALPKAGLERAIRLVMQTQKETGLNANFEMAACRLLLGLREEFTNA